MKNIKVFIGGDREKLKEILGELEYTSSIKWWGKYALADLLTYYGDSITFLFVNKTELLATHGRGKVGVEVTPEEFISVVQNEFPKKTDWSKVPQGTEILCTEDGEIWFKETFIAYVPDIEYPFITKSELTGDILQFKYVELV